MKVWILMAKLLDKRVGWRHAESPGICDASSFSSALFGSRLKVMKYVGVATFSAIVTPSKNLYCENRGLVLSDMGWTMTFPTLFFMPAAIVPRTSRAWLRVVAWSLL